MLLFCLCFYTIATMAELPFDLLEKIADVADIDTRRHMGFPPRKLCSHRLKAMEYNIRRRSSMQHKYLETIGETLVYVCSTLMPITNKKLLHIAYSLLFNKTYNAIYIMHPCSPNQDVDIVSCHGICCKLAPAASDIIRPLL